MSVKELGAVQLVENELSNGNTLVYKVVNGTYYHADTPQAVVNALETVRDMRTRIRIWLGDALGNSWIEEHDVEGYVGRSTGTIKVPLMIYNSRSFGGSSILDNHIIRISIARKSKDSYSSRDLYRHPNFRVAEMRVAPSDLTEYSEIVEVRSKTGNWEVHARFRKAGQAARWIAKMN